jgi:uncharacterized SAM-binding protein YcdF (DUF218 family)
MLLRRFKEFEGCRLAGQASTAAPKSTASHKDAEARKPFFRPIALGFMMAAIGLMLAGFVHFIGEIGRLSTQAPIRQADGIVVLTGGKARVGTALQLLAEGSGKRLLISGVHPDSSLESIRRAVSGSKDLFGCCIDIDKNALDTVGNAEEAAMWAKAKGFRSLIIVTSDYHMPRSMIEFRRKLPDVSLSAFEVQSNPPVTAAAIADPASLRILVPEYLKYVVSRLRLGLRESSVRTAIAGGLGKNTNF